MLTSLLLTSLTLAAVPVEAKAPTFGKRVERLAVAAAMGKATLPKAKVGVLPLRPTSKGGLVLREGKPLKRAKVQGTMLQRA